MAQRNIDFGSFPDDPNADAIRTAFDKVQQNFSELFSGLQEQAVISVNRTAGVGTSVNSPTGNVIISANIAQVRIQSTTLDLVAGAGTPGPLAVINQGTVPISINLPQSVTGIANINLSDTLTANTVNVSLQLNGNIANFTGNITSMSNVIAGNVYANSGTIAASSLGGTLTTAAQPNITSVGALSALSVTGNLSSGNANLGNLAVANFFQGDGSLLTNVSAIANTRILNGTSFANIPVSGGNLNIVIGGNSTMNVTATGANITGTLNVTGNVTAGNLIGILANGGTSNITIASATGNVTTAVAGTARITATSAGANVTGTLGVSSTLSVTGNADVGNLGTAQVLASANVTSPQFISNIATGTAPLTVTSTTRVANLNVAYANVADFISVAAGTGNNFLIFANAATGNVTELTSTGLTANLSNNSITATTFVGALSGAATTAGTVTTAAQPNITSVGTLTSLDVSGTVTAAAFTANTGIFTGNGSALTALNASNISSGTLAQARLANSNVILGNTALALGTTTTTVTGLSSVTSTAFVGDLTGAATSATTAGTVTTNAQPNITSVGTLTSLGVSGTVTASAFTANTGIFTGNGSALTELNASNISSGTLAQARLANSNVILGNTTLALGTTTTTIAGLSSVTSTTFVGALTGAATSATTAGTVTTAAQPNITSVGTLSSVAVTANATAGNVYANSGTIGASLLAGTLITAAQPNITSTGTLSNLNVSGNIIAPNITANTGVFSGNAAGLTNIPGANVAGTVPTATTAGTVTTAAQPNITSVGTLSSLAVTGNLSSGNANLGNAATANFFVGDGSLLTNIAVGAGSFIQNGNSEVRVDANSNVRVSIAGTANVLTVTATGANVAGTANVTGNLVAGNISATSIVGNLTTAAQTNITSLGTLTGLTVNGVSNLGANSNVVITGGVANAFLRTNGSGGLIWDTATLIPAQGENTQVIFNGGGSNYAGSNSLTFNNSTNVLTVAGNITAGNISGSNNIFSNFFTGTLRTAAQPNITSVGTLTTLGVSNTVTAVAFTANTGVFTGNGSGLTALNASNISTGTVSTDRLSGNYPINITGNAAFATTATSANTAGTVTTNAQGNITSVGTLVGLTVTGTINAGNVTATLLTGTITTAAQPNITSVSTSFTGLTLAANGNITLSGASSQITGANLVSAGFFSGNGSSITGINANSIASGTLAQARLANSNVILGNTTLTLGSTTTTVAGLASVTSTTFVGSLTGAATTAGTVTTAAQGNITSVGTLTSLAVTGNISAGNVSATTFTGALSGAATTAGTVTTAAQPNITSVGTLTSLSVTGNISAGNVSATTFTGALSGAATTAGTVTTAAQPNITSVGTLTSLAVTGNASAGNISTGGVLSVTGNANVSNLGTARVIATGNISGTQLISNIATGTAPLVVTSTTRVANLNVATAGTADSATNAAAVLNNVRSTGTYYPAFISATANGNYALNSNTAIYANLNTGTLYATAHDGNLSVSDVNFATTIVKTGVDTAYFGNTAATSGAVTFERFRGNITVFTEVSNGDRLGLIEFVAWDGFSPNAAASITSIVDAAYTSGAGSAPGAIVFNTANTAQGGVPTEKMRVASTGNVGIANTNPGHTLSITGTLSASGNANVGNIGAAAGVFTGNISAANVVATGYHIRSVETGIIALGLTQGTAVALTKEINVVSTVVPLLNSGVKLPVAVPGMVITITNTSANAVLVWPNTGADINGGTINTAYSHSSGATLQYIAPTTTDWYTVGATFA